MTRMSPLLFIFMGLFGGNNGPDIDEIAARVGSRPSEQEVLHTLDRIAESVDRLTADAGIAGKQGYVETDAPPAEKLRTLANLVERGELSVELSSSAADEITGEHPTERVAKTVERSHRPASRRAATLLDVLQSPSGVSDDELTSMLESVVDRLEAAWCVEKAAQDDDTMHAAATLGTIDDPLADAIEDHLPDATQDEAVPIAVSDAVDRAVQRAPGVDVAGDASVTDRIEALAEAAVTESNTPVAQAARGIQRDNRAACLSARDLLDGVVAGDEDSATRALRDAVDALNESATIRNVTDDVDGGGVRSRIDTVRSSLQGIDSPIAATIDSRIDQLEEMLQRADESNTVIPYAVREEVEFYASELAPVVESSAGTAPGQPSEDVHGDVAATIDELESRRAEIETNYVEVRDDHNHSIPMYFVSLAEDLVASTRDAHAAGQSTRAAGLAEATHQLLDHVEGLYERNEYSVMLRRLRG